MYVCIMKVLTFYRYDLQVEYLFIYFFGAAVINKWWIIKRVSGIETERSRDRGKFPFVIAHLVFVVTGEPFEKASIRSPKRAVFHVRTLPSAQRARLTRCHSCFWRPSPKTGNPQQTLGESGSGRLPLRDEREVLLYAHRG